MRRDGLFLALFLMKINSFTCLTCIVVYPIGLGAEFQRQGYSRVC